MKYRSTPVRCAVILLITLAAVNLARSEAHQSATSDPSKQPELTRSIRSWEFLDAVGQRAALFGKESGEMEGWVYPLKVFRNFQLRFHTERGDFLASDFARQLTVHPEGPSLVYAAASFEVRETLLVLPTEPGAIIRLDIDTFEPLQIEAQFLRDFQLMWPAAIGGTYMGWDTQLNAFTFGHEQRRFAAVLGSPDVVEHRSSYFSNSGSSDVNSISLRKVEKGHSTQYIFFAGGTNGMDEARAAYQRISTRAQDLESAARKYYSDFLDRTVSLTLPDKQIQAAYDWSRISVIQGLVNNPFLGTGLIAGYRTSGDSARPGFAWFFGRDSLWTDLALDAIGDFATARIALDFISKHQRDDGKVEHEVSQSATLVPWFKEFPYPYASADATPLFILAMNDYVSSSGDVQFLTEHWNNVWRAYQFLHSTYDEQGLPKNFGVGHGWVEGGPLLPVKTESYQSGLGAAALNALANLARLLSKADIQKQLEAEYAAQKQIINQAFWSPDKKTLVFALDQNNRRVDAPTVLSTAPMWFDVFDPAKANSTIDQLAVADHSTDWGMRIISNQNPVFDPTGYHFGSVWPLFTGWAAVGEYAYHRPLPAYENLRANALLALDGPLGHVTEVLSGTYYEALPTSSPHQIWSSAMVLTPVIRGLLGISSSATEHRLSVAPHLPADWNSWSAKNVPACGGTVDLDYTRAVNEIKLQALRRGTGSCTLVFSPAVSLRARLPGKAKLEETITDKHPTVTFELAAGTNTFKIPVSDDFGLVIPADLPALGSTSRNLKIVREQWSADRKQLRLTFNGIAGNSYSLKAYGSKIVSAEGGKVVTGSDGSQLIEVVFPTVPAGGYQAQELKLNFANK
jgi:glycogen debranching enzyme